MQSVRKSSHGPANSSFAMLCAIAKDEAAPAIHNNADPTTERLRMLRAKSERVCLISGGEVTVKVVNGGTGGRNQQFALACARKISGEAITVLSAGTDGIDGNSPAAGAIVDGSTLERARARGLDPEAHLAGFNAYPFFESLGDAITTGPTGNNLRDLRILLAY